MWWTQHLALGMVGWRPYQLLAGTRVPVHHAHASYLSRPAFGNMAGVNLTALVPDELRTHTCAVLC